MGWSKEVGHDIFEYNDELVNDLKQNAVPADLFNQVCTFPQNPSTEDTLHLRNSLNNFWFTPIDLYELNTNLRCLPLGGIWEPHFQLMALFSLHEDKGEFLGATFQLIGSKYLTLETFSSKFTHA